MNSLRERVPLLLRQLVKFGLVGGVGFVVDVGGFNLLRFAGGEGPLYDYPLSAKLVSGAAATLVAWLGNRYWTFRHSRRAAAHHELLNITKTVGISNGSAKAGLWVSPDQLGFRSALADNISANGVGLALATAFRFWAYRRHVFSEHGDGTSLSEIAEQTSHHSHGGPHEAEATGDTASRGRS